MTTEGANTLKVRLVIPICDRNAIREGYRCEESSNIEERFNLLKDIFKVSYKKENENYPDLIVTSNNFLDYTNSKDKKTLYHILKEVENELQQNLNSPKVKHLILGFDIPPHLNLSNGIPAVVSYWKFEDYWNLDTSILETWNVKNCDMQNFCKQNTKRVININSFKITILSCGDIQKYCHCNGLLIPDCDVIIDLAHLNYGLGKRVPYDKYTQSFLEYFNSWEEKPNLAILITTQVTDFKKKIILISQAIVV